MIALSNLTTVAVPSSFCWQYAIENEELTQHLRAAKDAQHQLTREVGLRVGWRTPACTTRER